MCNIQINVLISLTGDIKVEADWPQHGDIEFKNVGLRYEENLDMVVKNANCVFKAGENVRIILEPISENCCYHLEIGKFREKDNMH